MDHPLLKILSELNVDFNTLYVDSKDNLNHEMKIYQEILLIYLNDEIPSIQDYFNTNKDILI